MNGDGDTFGEGLAYGTYGLGSSLGDILDFFGAPDHGKLVRDFFEERRKKYSPAESIQGNVIDNPELLGNLDWWSFNLGQIAPSIVSTVVPGLGGAKVAQMLGAGVRGMQIGGAVGAGISGGMLEAAGAYREAKDRGWSDEDARKVFVGMGLGSALLNAIPAGAMLGKGGLMNRTLAAGVGEGLTEAAEEPLQAALMGDDMGEAWKQAATVAPVAFVSGLVGGGAGGAAAPRAQTMAAPSPVEMTYGQGQEEVQGQVQEADVLTPRAAVIAPPIVTADAVNATQPVEEFAPSTTTAQEMPAVVAAPVQPAAPVEAAIPTFIDASTATSFIPANTMLRKISDSVENAKGVKQLIVATVNSNPELFEAAKRGKRSWETTSAASRALAADPKQIEKFAKRELGEAYNVETLDAAGIVGIQAQQEYTAMLKAYDEKVRLGTATKEDEIALREAFTAAAHYFSVFTGASSESARALNILRKMKRDISRNPELANLQKVFSEVGMDEANFSDAMDMYRALNEANADPRAIARFMRDASQVRKMDKVMELWKNMLLSGPPTHVVNVSSNLLVGALENAERFIAAGIGKLTGSKDAVTFGEATARVYGMAAGAREAIRKAGRAILNEEAANFTKADQKQKFIGGTPGKLARFFGYRLLGAEDVFAKHLTYSAELHALAYAEAKKRGLNPTDIVAEATANPTGQWKSLVHKAEAAAAVATFSQKLGPIGQSIQRVIRAHPTLGFIMPFVQTPTNIIKYAMKRTLLARLFKDVRTELASGGRARDMALARLTSGTAIAVMTIQLAKEGLITGQGPDDEREKALLRMQGWSPYSRKIGDTYVPFNRMEPLGILMGIAADATEMARVMDAKEMSDIGALLIGSITRNLTNKTYLKGLSEMIEAIYDPERYGKNFVKNLAGTVIPTGVAVAARTDDPFLRRADTVMEQIRSRIPGLRDNLLPKLDRAGNPIKLDEPLGPDWLSPWYGSVEKRDIVAKEIYRLHQAGHDVPTGAVGDKISGHKLNAEQHNLYIKYAGDGWRALESLMQRQGWDYLPDNVKSEIVSDVIAKSRKLARVKTILEHPELLSQ